MSHNHAYRDEVMTKNHEDPFFILIEKFGKTPFIGITRVLGMT
jgi:hypothetical protein